MSNISMTTSKRNAIVTVMLISAFVSMLNQTILNTALPAIIKGLNITETTAQWLITGFMLVNGIMIPLTAFLMDKQRGFAMGLAGGCTKCACNWTNVNWIIRRFI